jgi:glucose 1-dehydrogenase
MAEKSRGGSAVVERVLPKKEGRKLEGEVAIVTGSDSGIGQAIAIEFARNGASVVVTFHDDRKGAEETRKRIEKEGSEAKVVQADVRKEKDIDMLFDACKESFGPATILVNNAGTDSSGDPVEEMEPETWRRTLDVNLTGPFLCCRRFLRDLSASRKKGGRILNVTGAAEYCASKGGLRNLTRCLALEVAERGVTVNNIAPGMILTPMNQEAIDNPRKLKKDVQGIPMHRAGEPEEIAKLALFLASSDGAYCTGSTFFMDGGLMQNLGQG